MLFMISCMCFFSVSAEPDSDDTTAKPTETVATKATTTHHTTTKATTPTEATTYALKTTIKKTTTININALASLANALTTLIGGFAAILSFKMKRTEHTI